MTYATPRIHPSPQNRSRHTGESSTPAMAARLDGAQHNHDHGTVETKTKRASCSGAHHDHTGVLGKDGDELERRGHGEVDGGGAPAGLEEERVAPGDSGQHKHREQAEEERKVEAITLV